MKKLIFTLIAVTAFVAVSCGPDDSEEKGGFYSINDEKTEILTAGISFENDGNYDLCFTPVVEDLLDEPVEYLYIRVRDSGGSNLDYVDNTYPYLFLGSTIIEYKSKLSEDHKSIDFTLTATLPADEGHTNVVFQKESQLKVQYKGALIEF